jgi:hypothetical protein
VMAQRSCCGIVQWRGCGCGSVCTDNIETAQTQTIRKIIPNKLILDHADF